VALGTMIIIFLDSTPSILNYKTFLTCTLLLVCKYTQCMSKCVIKVMYLEKPNGFIIAKMSYNLERNDTFEADT
jgi:hypothetical protein